MSPAPAFWLRPQRDAAPPFFSEQELGDVRAFYQDAPSSPLHHLHELAPELGVADIAVKDETSRFGLQAFKIVGARYAIDRLIREHGRTLTDVACATAGNHGRAVARVARDRALGAHVYVPVGTARSVVDALEADGAHVATTSVDYDRTVRLMAEDAAESGWTIVSDTAWEGNEQIPRWIMAGYTRIFDEADAQAGGPPDVLIVQAGVGSFAGAAAAWCIARYGADRPKLIVVEPAGSACVMTSLQEGRRVDLRSCEPTTMAGLRCAEVSSIAWPVLEHAVDGAIAIGDDTAAQAVQRLSQPRHRDPAISAGPSGAAGIGALIALGDPSLTDARAALGIGASTRVLAVVTEGST